MVSPHLLFPLSLLSLLGRLLKTRIAEVGHEETADTASVPFAFLAFCVEVDDV